MEPDNETTRQAVERSPESAPFRWATRVIVPVACVVLGFVLSVIWQSWSNRLRTLQYYETSSSAIIKKPELGGKIVEIFVDKIPLDNISTVRVDVYNHTDQDFADLPLEISFASDDGRALVLLQSVVKPRLDAPVEVGQPSGAQISNEARFSYILRVVNRFDDPVFQGEYAFAGSEAPSVRVAIPMKGVTIEPIHVANPRGVSPFSATYVISAVVAGGTLAAVLNYINRSLARRAVRRPLNKASSAAGGGDDGHRG